MVLKFLKLKGIFIIFLCALHCDTIRQKLTTVTLNPHDAASLLCGCNKYVFSRVIFKFRVTQWFQCSLTR